MHRHETTRLASRERRKLLPTEEEETEAARTGNSGDQGDSWKRVRLLPLMLLLQKSCPPDQRDLRAPLAA